VIPTTQSFVLLLTAALVAGWGVYEPVYLRWGLIAFGALVVLMVLDHWLSRRLAQVELRRYVAERLSLGAANKVTLEISNRCRLPLALLVKDDAPWEFEASRREHHLHLAPYEHVVVSYTVTPRGRGDFDFGDLHVRGRSLLTLSQWQRTTPARQPVKVYPDLLGLDRYTLLARQQRLAQAGFRPLRYLGEGTEFESLREYSPDDDYRKIDWKATARRGRPITRQYDLERSQTLVLMIDAGRMMCAEIGGMSKLDYAINAALMLAYVAAERDDSLGLVVFADQVQTYLPPRKGSPQVGAIADQLYAVQPVLREPDYAAAFALLRHRVTRRALVVIFTDLIDQESSHDLLTNVLALTPRHLPLIITLRDYRLDALARQRPQQVGEAYERAVALNLLSQRRLALASLRAGGAQILDSRPQELTVATVNKYLEIKQRARL